MNEQSRLFEIAPDVMSEAQNNALEIIKGGRGFVPTPYKIWLHSPELAERMSTLGAYVNLSGSLQKREVEIVAVMVARHLSSPYVFETHLRLAAEAGLSETVVAALIDGFTPAFANPREQAVYEITQTGWDDQPASDASFAQAVDVLGRDGLAELLALIGYFTATSIAMKLHRVPLKT